MNTLTTNRFSELLHKYNVPAPRYTSYPTVPYWDNGTFSAGKWKQKVKEAYSRNQEISVYIHLPYCESLCTYCGCNTRITRNHAVETPYIAALLKEWVLYTEILGEKPTIGELHLGGGTPTFFQPKNLEHLIKRIFESANASPEIEMSFEVHPNNTSYEHLKILRDVGFGRISIGVQDFDPKILKVINRKQTAKQVEQCTTWARGLGYTSVNYDFVYGLPFQKEENIIENINQVKALKPERIAFYSYAHVPWVKPGQRAYSEADLPSGNKKRALYELGRDMLEGCGYQEIGMDHFALPTDDLYKAKELETLHRNFMGYTPKHTELMIGLGVSSISDAWQGFAQNEKKVEDYLDRITNEELAVSKGHVLSKEDERVRVHILNIMCHLKTEWQLEDQPYMHNILERLSPLVADSLVEVNQKGLKVTKEGQPFLRNISMALDEQLWARQPETVDRKSVV